MKTTKAMMGTLRGTVRVIRFVTSTIPPDTTAVEPISSISSKLAVRALPSCSRRGMPMAR